MDIHEGTVTVREALVSLQLFRKRKRTTIEEMVDLLELQDHADALVFGFSVETRKRLTIGVELASKPEFLLFYRSKLEAELPNTGLPGI